MARTRVLQSVESDPITGLTAADRGGTGRP
jgi:hypothetical protein